MVKLVPLRNVGAGFFFLPPIFAGHNTCHLCTEKREYILISTHQAPLAYGDIAHVIAPIFLPFFALLASLSTSPAPVLEWHVSHCHDDVCTVHLELFGAARGEVSKLSLVSNQANGPLKLVASNVQCDDHWSRKNTLNWMWQQAPNHIALDVDIRWDSALEGDERPNLDVVWEHVHQGERQAWTLGSVVFPALNPSKTPNPVGTRTGTAVSSTASDIQLNVSDAVPGSFVKWTEYIPEGCTCDVLESSGASLRKAENRQIFLWFEVKEGQLLAPSYRLNCAESFAGVVFDGELEFAFGTATKSLHIAEVEWVGVSPAQNENMELNQSPDATSASSLVATIQRAETPGSPDVQFSVQLLANHRDLSASEVTEALGYSDSFHIFRHEGWHKYLTDDFASYAEAREKRSNLWSTTSATDAFVAASLNGERISVQEALLMSNQSWIP